MEIVQVAGIIIGSIISLGVLIAGAGYGYGQFYKGKNEKTKDDYNLIDRRLTTLQDLCDKQQRDIDGHQADIKKLNQEIGRLQGINQEKEKKIEDLTRLLENRDPALSEYLAFARSSIMEFKEGFKNIDGKINQILSEGRIK